MQLGVKKPRQTLLELLSVLRAGDHSSRRVQQSLLRPHERRRRIVMSMSLCVSVCPPLHDISGTTYAIFTNFSVHVAYGRGSVFRQGDEIPREGAVWGFSSPLKMHCNALAENNVKQQKESFHRHRAVMGGHRQRGRSEI